MVLHCPNCSNGMTEYIDGYMCETAGDVCGFMLVKLGYGTANMEICPCCRHLMYRVDFTHWACPKCRFRRQILK